MRHKPLRAALLAAITVLTACTRGSDAECTAELTANPTVPRVSVVGAPDEAWVEYGEDDFDLSASTTGDVVQDVLLLGLGPLEDVAWRVVSRAEDGEPEVACAGEISTGNLPAGLPRLSVLTDVPELRSPEKWLLVTYSGTDRSGGVLLIERSSGDTLWATPIEPGEAAVDVHLLAGPRVQYNVLDPNREADLGEIREVGLDGTPTGAWRMPQGHHMFARVPDGFAYTALDVRPWVDEETGATVDVAGDAVVVVDRASGETRTLTSTWDWLPVVPNLRWEIPFYGDAELRDWTHASGLAYDAGRSELLLTLANAGVLARIDASTGAPLQVFGPGGDTPFPPDPRFDHPHDPSWVGEDRVLLFTDDAATGRGGAVELDVAGGGQPRIVWSYGHDEYVAQALGGASRLDNGNTLLSFGMAGVLQEVTPSGEIAWEAHLPLGFWFSRVRPVEDLYAR